MIYKSIIIQNEDEAKFIVRKSELKNKNFLAFSPDIRLILVQNSISNIFPTLDHFFDHSKVSKKLIEYEGKLNKILDNRTLIYDHIEETFTNLFYSILSSIEFYRVLISQFDKDGPWLVYKKNTFELVYNFDEIISIIASKLINEKKGIFHERRPINYRKNKKLNSIFDLLNKIIIKKSSSNGLWLTSTIYGQKTIIEKNKVKYPKLKMVYISPPYGNTLLKLFKNFYTAIFNKTNIFEIIPNVTKRKNFNECINIILDNILNKDDFLLKKILVPFFSDICEYQYSLHFEVLKYFNLNPPKILIAHQLNLFEPATVGSIFKDKSKKVFLISHGSHRVSNNNTTNFELFRHARGLLYSRFATHIFIQEKSAFELLNKIGHQNYKFKILFCDKPFMWSVQKINKENKKLKKDIIFLHASTFKMQSLRVEIFENSFEYLDNIITLSKEFSKLKGCKLVLRLRNLDECKIDTIKYYIKEYKNVFISKNISFKDDLEQTHCLISFSSTAIEEAYFNSIQVGLIDFNKKNNIEFNLSNLITRLNKKKLQSQLENLIIKIKTANQSDQISDRNNFLNKNKSLDFDNFIDNLFHI